jgi:hypothetical protein
MTDAHLVRLDPTHADPTCMDQQTDNGDNCGQQSYFLNPEDKKNQIDQGREHVNKCGYAE